MIDVCNVVCSKTKYNKQAVISSTDSTDSNGPEGVLVCCACRQCGTWTIRISVLRNTFIPKSNGCLGLASEDSIVVFVAISQRKSYLEPVELVYFNYLTCVLMEFCLH